MKSIEQLLQLSQNEHYSLTNEEQERLDAFLAERSGQSSQAKSSGKTSSSDSPATVKNKNVVAKHDPNVPTEVSKVEELVHPDAVLEDAETAQAAKENLDNSATVSPAKPL